MIGEKGLGDTLFLSSSSSSDELSKSLLSSFVKTDKHYNSCVHIMALLNDLVFLGVPFNLILLLYQARDGIHKRIKLKYKSLKFNV